MCYWWTQPSNLDGKSSSPTHTKDFRCFCPDIPDVILSEQQPERFLPSFYVFLFTVFKILNGYRCNRVLNEQSPSNIEKQETFIQADKIRFETLKNLLMQFSQLFLRMQCSWHSKLYCFNKLPYLCPTQRKKHFCNNKLYLST